MTQHVFLSDEWLAAAHQIVEEHGPADVDATSSLIVNVVVTNTPFDSDRLLHVGMVDGRSVWGSGHHEAPDVTLTTDYETAKVIFVAGDQQVVTEALLAGRMKIQGDLAKLMAAQAAGVGPLAPGLARSLREMTA